MSTPNTQHQTPLAHEFSRVPHLDIRRSTLKRSFKLTTTCDPGYLVPCLCDEILPGDTFNVNLSAIGRLNTPVLPFMDSLYLDFFFFFVPNRLLWENWKRLMGEKDDPDDSIDFTVPKVTTQAGGHASGSMADYFGIPTLKDGVNPNALHFRAYNLIWKEFFRSQQLHDSPEIRKDDGPDLETYYPLLKRCKKHDYFTSALPYAQVGDSITLPLGTEAPVKSDGYAISFSDGTASFGIGTTGASNHLIGMASEHKDRAIGTVNSPATYPLTANKALGLSSSSHIYADLTSATAATINSLREAFQLQKMLEKEARSGSRYTEINQAFFGVTSPDSRLQRPEYLGGGSSRINIQAVPHTATTTNQVGDLGAIGYVNSHKNGFTKSFTEHGVLLGLLNVRSAGDHVYQHGLDRMWSRQTKFDFFWPELQSIGEQAILGKELYYNNDAGDDTVWGYQERYAEYKYKNSMVTGLMRSNHPQSLDVWHLAEHHTSLPGLNSTFIEMDPPISRVVGVTTQPALKVDLFYSMNCTRPMAMYSIPGMGTSF